MAIDIRTHTGALELLFNSSYARIGDGVFTARTVSYDVHLLLA